MLFKRLDCFDGPCSSHAAEPKNRASRDDGTVYDGKCAWRDKSRCTCLKSRRSSLAWQAPRHGHSDRGNPNNAGQWQLIHGPLDIISMSIYVRINIQQDNVIIAIKYNTLFPEWTSFKNINKCCSGRIASVPKIHQVEIFSVQQALCERNPPVTGGFPSNRPMTRSFGAFFEVRLSRRLSKQSRYSWFETPWRSL